MPWTSTLAESRNGPAERATDRRRFHAKSKAGDDPQLTDAMVSIEGGFRLGRGIITKYGGRVPAPEDDERSLHTFARLVSPL
jgi:hypothetical protein